MMFFQIILLQIVLFILNNIFLVSYKFQALGGIPISIIARDASILMVCLPCLLQILYVRIYAFQPDFEYERQTTFVFFVAFAVHAIASGLTTSGSHDLSGVMPSLVAYAICLVSIYTVEPDHTIIKLGMWALTTYVSLVIIHGIIFGLFKRNFQRVLSIVYIIAIYIGMTVLIIDDFYRKQLLDLRFIAIISAFISLFYPIRKENNDVNAVLTQLEPFIQTKALGGSVLNQITDAPESPVSKLTEEELDTWIKEAVGDDVKVEETKQEEVKPKPKSVTKKVVIGGSAKFGKKKF
jgi:hypothetical protein